MTYKENITAILECYFTGFKKEIIDSACNRILDQEPKTGHWIENAPEYQNIDPPYICSECGNMHLRKTNYCDQCGAKMVEPQESEEV